MNAILATVSTAFIIVGIAVLWSWLRAQEGFKDATGFHPVTRPVTEEEMDRALGQNLTTVDADFTDEEKRLLAQRDARREALVKVGGVK